MPLPTLKRRLLLMASAALLGACVGCTLRQSKDAYRLSKIDSQYFLIPPGVSQAPKGRQTLRISRRARRRYPGAVSVRDCSIKRQWFSFYSDVGNPSYWIAETPTAEAWEQSAGYVDMEVQWQKFQQDLYALQQRQCFASIAEYRFIKERIASSLSSPAEDTLFYRYSFGPGGYVDLAPGMQVRIERNLFENPSATQQDSASYRGTTTTYYEVTRDSESGTRLKFLRTEKRSAGSARLRLDSSDGMLAAQFAGVPRLRLFLQGLVISGNAKSPAILIGASNINDLDEATQAIESDSAITCSGLTGLHVTCVLFHGLVTVSPMLAVFVNGRRTYVPIGTRLWLILPRTTKSQQTTLMRSLRVQRSFEGKPIDVQFPRNFEAVSQLLVFGGDRISWAKARGPVD